MRGELRARVALTVVGIMAMLALPSVAGSSEFHTASLRAGSSSCVIPTLPRAGAPTGASGALRMIGPAVTSLTGHAARQAFTVDGTNLVVGPPEPGDRPVISAREAECDALSSLNDQNAPLSGSVGSGVAMGYARVTVASSFFPPPSGPPGLDTTPGDVQPVMPPSTPYQNRLAWVVVLTHQVVVMCPEETSTPHPAVRLPTDFYYQVFLVDALTGNDALIYSESQPGQCGFAGRQPPSLIQPRELVSVPWTLRARNADGYSGTIVASMLPCDGYSNPVLIDRPGSGLQVIVTRPVGASCGSRKLVALTVHAATVTSDLPAVIAHDPTGPYTGLAALPRKTSPSASRPTTTTTSPQLVNIAMQNEESTVTVKVGQVIVVIPDGNLVRQSPAFTSPVISSDPTVLGGLSKVQPMAAEFRAWKPGRARLLVPSKDCRTVPAHPATCWLVHVVVH